MLQQRHAAAVRAEGVRGVVASPVAEQLLPVLGVGQVRVLVEGESEGQQAGSRALVVLRHHAVVGGEGGQPGGHSGGAVLSALLSRPGIELSRVLSLGQQRSRQHQTRQHGRHQQQTQEGRHADSGGKQAEEEKEQAEVSE